MNSSTTSPSAASALEGMTSGSRTLEVQIYLLESQTPAPLWSALALPRGEKELECFLFEIGYGSVEHEAAYTQIEPATKAANLIQYEDRSASQRPHIRPVSAMYIDAVDFLTLVAATLGFPHHWILVPVRRGQHGHLEATHDDRDGERVSQAALFREQISLSEWARRVAQGSRFSQPFALTFALTFEPDYAPDSHVVPKWLQAAAMQPQPSTNWSRLRWTATDEVCVLTGESGIEGAHLIPHSYHDVWHPILAAVYVALEDTPSSMDTYFASLKAGIHSLVQLGDEADFRVRPMTLENDILPLTHHNHYFLDRHNLLLNPFAATWLWVSRKALTSRALILSLDPLPPVEVGPLAPPKEAQFERLLKMKKDSPRRLPPMLVSACRGVLHALGTPELLHALRSGAGESLATRKGTRRGTDASSSQHSSLARRERRVAPPTSIAALTRPKSAGAGDGSSSDRERTTAQEEAATHEKGDRSSSSFTAAETSTGSDSSAQANSHSSGSLSLSSMLSTQAPSVLQTSGEVAKLEPVMESPPLTRGGLASREFDDWWASDDGGRRLTGKHRRACLRLEQISFAEVPIEEEERVDAFAEEGSYRRAEELYKHTLISDEEYARLDCSYEQHGKDLALIGGEEEYRALLSDRISASFYLVFPNLLMRGAGLQA